MTELGPTIRKIRKNRQLSLKEAAAGILSYSALAAFERGEYTISFQSLLKLLARLNFSLTELSSLVNLPA
ncbi:helix-turn-helix domain-containing protein [Lapidilactobacillus wuchangensis]|uniref:helix-turn-helix domain-containing protein n=1 Tax=Lapidilactobacillus wuchangensis TaxID=2486001 RepID=UPI000F78DAEA|nr:helix-turn-helix transcriptional regulator [Lapidilactobacillus wuchangensis]